VAVQVFVTFPADGEERLFDMRFPPPRGAHATGADHAHGSPHGGLVAAAGADAHLELLRDGRELRLWLLDANEATRSVADAAGTLLVQGAGAPVTVPLSEAGDSLVGPSPIGHEPATVIASVTIAGATHSARFALPRAETPANAFAEIAQQYERVRLALAADSTAGIADAARRIAEVAEPPDGLDAARAGVDAPELEQVRALLPDIATAARKLAAATDLAAARTAFDELTRPLLRWRALVSGARPAVAYCPMADKSWMQPDGTIANPFYGSAMLRCGTITDR
jgi:hypothetical protein